MSVPNETWSERFEREFEAALALLRRRPLLALVFAGAMLFLAWHQFFNKKELLPGASQTPGVETRVTVPMSTRGANETMVNPDEKALAANAHPPPAQDTVAAPAHAADAAATKVETDAIVAAVAEAASASFATSVISLTDYFDRPILIGNSRKEVSEKILDATWGQNAQGIFASVSTSFLGQFHGLAMLYFSSDRVTQVIFRYEISGSTMRNYRLHGTEDDWDEKVTTNGEEMSYAEATAKCTAFQKLRAELIRKFGAAKSMQDIPIPTPDQDSRTKKYSRPVEEQFNATFATAEIQLHIEAYDLAFIREQTHTSMAKDKLSNRSCSIRAVFTNSSAPPK